MWALHNGALDGSQSFPTGTHCSRQPGEGLVPATHADNMKGFPRKYDIILILT
jgi:hypothetical protein